MRVLALLILATVFSFGPSDRANGQSFDDGGLWFAALGNGDLNATTFTGRRLKWWFDAHYRLLDDADGFNQSIVRPGLGVDLGNNAAAWAGYGWIRTSPVTGDDFDEHRLFQQFTWSPSCCGLKFLHRSRFEQRLVETGDDTGLRWRELLRVQGRPGPRGFSPVIWDEVFYNLNNTDFGARAGFDQNRFFIGLRFPERSKLFKSEVGYLNQVIDSPNGPTRVNHIASINFFF